ncbi:MAG TPA: hypothetical protein VGF94_12225, partial [Kofleriaceae bacterium]
NRAVSRARRSRRSGAVFPDRYHARILKSPTSVRNAIRYVVNNWRKHQEHRAALLSEFPIDPFSSGRCAGEIASSPQRSVARSITLRDAL